MPQGVYGWLTQLSVRMDVPGKLLSFLVEVVVDGTVRNLRSEGGGGQG